MARHRPPPDPDDGSEDEEPEPEDEPSPRRSSRGRRPVRGRRGPVRRWRSSDSDEAGEDVAATHWRKGEKPPVFWRARDSLYFGPLVALAIVVLLVVSMYAYTQNWPPIYVVESPSMQHGSSDTLGAINTGDLVLATRVPTSAIQPYFPAVSTGYSTYGEAGDVILYHPDGGGATPIIHRAILFLSWDAAAQAYNASGLSGLPCGTASGAYYATPGTPGSCGTTDLTGTLDLYQIGWRNSSVTLNLSAPALGAHSGFLTMGDNNTFCTPGKGCLGLPDQAGGGLPFLSHLVEPSWILGVARGMIPWFGALKLLLGGNVASVPPQSWEFMGLTLAALILLGVGVHFALRAEGVEDPRRRAEEAAAEEEPEEELPDLGEGSRARRWLRSLRPWREEEDDAEEDLAPRRSRSTLGARRGRPRPRVRRVEKSHGRPRATHEPSPDDD